MKIRLVIDRLLWGLLVAGWVGLAVAADPAAKPTTPAQSPVAGKGGPAGPPAVTVAQVTRRAVPVELKTVGAVQAVVTVNVRSRIDGEVTALHFREGEAVRRDDPLFSLDARAAAIQLRQTEAVLARDRAALANARREVTRLSSLAANQVSSRQQLDKATTEAEMLEAAVRADEAQVANAGLQLSFTEIRSPLTGQAGAVTLYPGNMVRVADATPLVTIHQLHPIQVAFAVPQIHLPALRQGRAALAAAVTIPGDGATPVRGQVTFMANAVDPATGAIQLKAELPNEERRLWPGQLVDVVLTLRLDAEALVAPAPAVLNGQRGTYVYVVGEGAVVQPRPVRVDRVWEGMAVIAEGLKEGEQVVTDGQFRLAPGAKVAR